MRKKTAKSAVKSSHPSIMRAKKIATVMDSAFTIPIINKKIGLDPLLGLLPVGGDVVSAAVGLYIVWLAVDLGMPRQLIVRMSANLLIDVLIGAVPVLGDMVDAMWKSNLMNVRLLEEAYAQYGVSQSIDDAEASAVVVDVRAEPIPG